ncbi:MAG: flagellar biosynthetic protein FliR [Gammaproteobacteria bacterium]
MQFNINIIVELIQNYLWAFSRIGAMVMVMPVLGSNVIPARIKLFAAVVITLAVLPSLPIIQDITVFSGMGLIVTLQQVLIGMAIGFIFQLVFQALIIGGQVIAMQSGLGFASMIDPGSGVSVPLISQFYLILASLLFLAVEGHLLLIEFIAQSFHYIPIAQTGITTQHIGSILTFSTWIFKGAAVVALPAILILLIANLAFGVMSRAAPQLNIFAIGFPMTIIFGIIIMFLTLGQAMPKMHEIMVAGFDLISTILR